MNKYIIGLVLFLAVPSYALVVDTTTVTVPVVQTIPPVSPNTPVSVKALADGLHILDNGTLMTLRDVQNGVYALGSGTSIYKKYYLSVDGLLGYLPNTQGANAFYAAGGRAWVGQLLYDNVSFVKTVADTNYLTAGLLQYVTVGWWGTRDFQYNLWRQGWDAGFIFKF
jgi:hypothetical protein